MQDFFTNKYVIALLVITVIIFALMAFSSGNGNDLSFGRRAVGAITTPVESAFTKTVIYTQGFFGHFADIDALRKQNKELSNQIDKLQNEMRSLTQYKVENEYLKSMLDLKQSTKEYNLATATVIAKEPGNWFNVFTIDKGEKDGIKKDQVVITSKGLVGSITEVAGNWAKVTAIIDSKSSVGASVTRTNNVAVVDGSADLDENGLCKLTYISKDSKLITGDLVETSGLGGIYPKGILIGKIREVKPEIKGMSQFAYIEPAVDFSKISEVFIIK